MAAVAPTEPSPASSASSEVAPWAVEKGTGWTPQQPRTSVPTPSSSSFGRSESDRSRDYASPTSQRPPTAPLFTSTPGASTSSPRLPPSSSSSRTLHSPEYSPESPNPSQLPNSPSSARSFDTPTSVLRSKSAGQARPSPVNRKAFNPPSKAYSAPSRSPRATYGPRGDSYQTRDDLLIQLLSSQAVLDSRDFEVLTNEEADDLKTEHAHLAKRITALRSKVTLESRMRDMSARLASSSKASAEKTEQLANATAKVDGTQRELLSAIERSAIIERRLLEHRAAVLSHTVQSMEDRARALDASDSTSSDNGTALTTMSGELSPVSTAPTTLSHASRTKFEGAHLFAGHSDAIVPSLPRAPPSWKEVDALQEQLRAATEARETAKLQAQASVRELSMLKLDRVELETRSSMEVQEAKESVSQLEEELEELRGLEAELEELHAAKEASEREQSSRIATLEQRLAAVSALSSTSPLRSVRSSQIPGADTWDDDFTAIRDELIQARQSQATNANLSRGTSEEVESGRLTLSELAKSLGIALPGSVSSVPALAAALAVHAAGMQNRLEEHARLQSGWEAERSQFEVDAKRSVGVQEEMSAELELTKKELDEARAELKETQSSIPSIAPVIVPAAPFSGDSKEELERITSVLQALYAQLPSLETRGKTLTNTNKGVLRSPMKSPKSPSSISSSISELDVRSLKSLFEAGPMHSGANAGPREPYSLELFAQRINNLLNDDRAIVARLIRMGSGHDLLKTNAETARKLAADTSQHMATYQQQVKILEERNAALVLKHTTMMDESAGVQDAMEKAYNENQALQAAVTGHTKTLADLEAARSALELSNESLKAEIEKLKREAAEAKPGALLSPVSAEEIAARKKLEDQLKATNKELEDAKEELTRISMAESMQRIQLLDELNTLQQENGNLRNQLRSMKK
ncbi:hypothetical protein DL93DRAFT_2087872 [Clavulina sp. PMI_390]|nr:hypothetical protein DL93DRAFT_2087872 [Clavulina sp. PMI_390]